MPAIDRDWFADNLDCAANAPKPDDVRTTAPTFDGKWHPAAKYNPAAKADPAGAARTRRPANTGD